MEFWTYYRVLRRRRWLIVATILVAVAIVLAVDRPSVGDYAATATLSIPSAQRFFFVAGAGVPAPEQSASNAGRTAMALSVIRSWDVAERVVRGLNLSITPDELLRRLSVEGDPFGGDLLRVKVTARTPREAVMLANGVAAAAASYDQEVKRREVTLAREFLERQSDEAQAKVTEAEGALLAFQQKNAADLAAAKGLQVSEFATDIQRNDLMLQEVDARLASVRNQLKGQNPTRADQVITDTPIARELRAQLAALDVALTSELALRTEKHASVIILRKRIQAVQERLNAEAGKAVAAEQVRFNPIYDVLNQTRINLETEKLALLARREALLRATGAGARALPAVAQKQIEQSKLIANVEMLRREYENLQRDVAVSRLREQEAQQLGSITLVNPARAAQPSPFGTRLFKVSAASLLGILGSAGLVFFLEYLDITLKIPENAERLLGVPTLVAIPQHNPPFDEAYRQLRVALEARKNGKAGKAFVVTSLKPGEGTSTVVANLARAFARAGTRTIVIDASLRRPTQHTRFGIANEKGLVQVLRGEAGVDDVLAKTDDANLSVLPAGGVIKETDELFGSGAIAEVLAGLKQRGGVILVDTPAAGAFTDAFSLAGLASGVLLVLDARQAPGTAAEQVKSQLTRLGAKVLGIVLTKVRPDLVPSYVNQENFYKAKRRVMPSLARPAALAAGALVIGIFTGLVMKAAQSEAPTAFQHTVAQWISAFSIPWLSGH
ncbi:MAG TPA: polysaccharide biosynthesis tyrosine autokinase [bacterium]